MAPLPLRLRRLAAVLLALPVTLIAAADFDYRLNPVAVAPDSYVIEGRREDFNFSNGGNIVNTAFVVTDKGVVVIDSGPSLRYGEQLRQAIARTTGKPVLRVFITHAHPDHFLGDQAFPAAIEYATAEAREQIRREGNAFAENMYRLNGDWMKGTEVQVPGETVTAGEIPLGDHVFEALVLSGHTVSDLALYDRKSGVLYAGDLVFSKRAPTTPHAEIAHWLASLDVLEAVTRRPGFTRLVPGHGPVAADAGPIRETRRYLEWLRTTLRQGAEKGEDMTEVLAHPRPEEFRDMAVFDDEYRRSVGRLYPAAEQSALHAVPEKR